MLFVARNVLKMWAPALSALSGASKPHNGPEQSYLRHGLLLAVDAEVVKRPHAMAYVHFKQCENCNTAARKRSSNDTAYMLYVWGPWNVHSGLILLL